MKADITPEPALNAEYNKANPISRQYDGEASQEQSCILWGNVSLESEGKSCHIRRRNQTKLCANYQDRSIPEHNLSIAANETMKQ